MERHAVLWETQFLALKALHERGATDSWSLKSEKQTLLW